MAEFWVELAKEEFVHSELLRKMDSNTLLLSSEEIGQKLLATIESFQTFIAVEKKRAGEEFVSTMDALAVAVNIERSILENRFFTFIDPLHPIYEVTVGRIVTNTREHENRVQCRFEAEKGRLKVGFVSKNSMSGKK